MSIPFPISKQEFTSTIDLCKNDNNCKPYAVTRTCDIDTTSYNKEIEHDTEAYNSMLNKIINHFNYIIALNNGTKTTLETNINNDDLEKRYVYYDSIDIDYQNTWIKKLTFWMYFVSILIYVLVFIINKSYKKKIEFLYLLLVIALPLFSNKILHIVNYFYNFNVLFTKN
jgi:hypothetical protein